MPKIGTPFWNLKSIDSRPANVGGDPERTDPMNDIIRLEITKTEAEIIEKSLTAFYNHCRLKPAVLQETCGLMRRFSEIVRTRGVGVERADR